jgi:hypothetical protein
MPCKARSKRTVITLLLGAVALCGMSSCIDIRVRAGTRPDVQLLGEKLMSGKSTMSDVRELLGEPYGTGSSMLPIQPAARTMWSYYYEEADLKDGRRTFLFIYFTPDDVYEGYLWFSSLPPSPDTAVRVVAPSNSELLLPPASVTASN